jgi:CheY-like chemotaxis protein
MGARILVIDDDPIGRRLVTYLLESRGHVALAAADGEAGLELARRDLPDLVLCDVQLPGIDGCEVLRRLRGDGRTAAIPVVALSAAVTDAERARIDAAGFDGRLDKPLRVESLAADVEAYLR